MKSAWHIVKHFLNFDLSVTQFTVGRCLGAAVALVLKGFCGGSKPPPYDMTLC